MKVVIQLEKEIEELVVNLYQQNKSLREISKILSISRHQITKTLKKKGVKLRSKSEQFKILWENQEFSEKCLKGQKNYWDSLNPKEKSKRLELTQEKTTSESSNEKRRLTMKRMWQETSFREKALSSMEPIRQKSSYKEKISSWSKVYWTDSAHRHEQSLRLKNFYSEHPEAREAQSLSRKRWLELNLETNMSLLTEGEEKRLALKIKEGDPSSRIRFINANIHLVDICLKEVSYNQENSNELTSAGYLGLISAVDNFQPKKGRFVPFAKKWIKGKMLHELRAKRGKDRRIVSLVEDAGVNDADNDSDFTNSLSEKELINKILSMDDLPRHGKEILELFLQGYNNAQIGHLISLSPAQVGHIFKKIIEIAKRFSF